MDAEEVCRDVLEAAPQQPQALYLLAESLRLQGRHMEAELQYKRCVLASPEYSEAWAALASILFEDLRWEESRRAANRALREDIWNGEAAFVRGALRERRGDYAGADRDFGRAWRSDPQAWPLPHHIKDEDLEGIIEEAIHSLHPTLQVFLSNIAIMLEDLPSDQVLSSYEPPASPTGLVGYFSGYTQMERSPEVPWSNLPSALVIFRRNVERVAHTRAEAVEHLRQTFNHEVGELLGVGHEELPEEPEGD